MKPKTAFIANIVLLALYVVMLIVGYALSIWGSLFQQIVFWILPVSPVLNIINYLQGKKRQEES